MFYSQVVLAKKGPLSHLWLAAHWDKKLSKKQIFATDIGKDVDNVIQPVVPLALRVSGHLMLGIVRIYEKKVTYLFSDCSEALVKIKMAFRPGEIDMNLASTTTGNIDVLNVNVNDMENNAFEGVSLLADDWMKMTSNVARYEDITLHKTPSVSLNASKISIIGSEMQSIGQQSGMLQQMDEEEDDEWTAFAPDEEPVQNESTMEIEVARNASRSSLPVTTLSFDQAAETPRVAKAGEYEEEEEDDVFMPMEEEDEEEHEMPIPEQQQEEEEVQQQEEVSRQSYGGGALADSTLDLVIDRQSNVFEQVEDEDEEQEQKPAEENMQGQMQAEAEAVQPPKPKERKVIKRKYWELDTTTQLSGKEIKSHLNDTSDIRVLRFPFQKQMIYKYKAMGEAEYLFDYQHDKQHDFNYLFQQTTLKMVNPRVKRVLSMNMSSTKLPWMRLEDFKSGSTTVASRKEEPEDVELAREDKKRKTMDNVETASDKGEEEDQEEEEEEEEAPILDQEEWEEEEMPIFDEEEEDYQQERAALPATTDASGVMEAAVPLPEDEDMDIEVEEAEVEMEQHKWHQRTINMMHLLQKQLENKDSLSYLELAKGRSKRTVAGCFFEILQLRTWGRIHFEQSGPYEDIVISKAAKFDYPIPK